MSLYVARIELHSKLYAPDFITLHRAMEQNGFEKSIRADDGRTYNLPRGEYVVTTDKGSQAVMSAAAGAVEATGQTAEIFITEVSSWISRGLTEKK